MPTRETDQPTSPSVLPPGRKSPKGILRWYLASCPVGREHSTCEKVRDIVPDGLLEDAFVPRKERHAKWKGVWRTDVVDLLKTGGYFIVATRDPQALAAALAKTTFPVQLAGFVGRGYAPISKDAQAFLSGVMDASRTVRLSWGEIVGEDVRVLTGPLVGYENRIQRVIRKKALALVRMEGDAKGEEFTLALPLAIPTRR